MIAAPTPAGHQREAGDPAKPDMLTRALVRRGDERFSGTLAIEGRQRGTIVIRDGLVIAATTAAAPGPESLILRSGRIPEARWSEAFAAAAPHGRLAEELGVRDLVGAAGLDVLTQTAIVDAVFAMALGGVSTCSAEPSSPDSPAPLLAADPGVKIDRLVREVSRRLGSAAEWAATGLRIDSRPRRTADPADRHLVPGRREILGKVNGRRSPRDIAFTLGRGLFPVMTDLALLINDGLITVEPLPSPPQPEPAKAEPSKPEPEPEPAESDPSKPEPAQAEQPRDQGKINRLIHRRRHT